jgi:hypothetical protein
MPYYGTHDEQFNTVWFLSDYYYMALLGYPGALFLGKFWNVRFRKCRSAPLGGYTRDILKYSNSAVQITNKFAVLDSNIYML